ncbi:MAG: hypothetical protein H6510_02540 [Acidobacteria bacterium]|nr:hypothetical protein [Acidobacteriota bacterium]
MKFSIFFLLGLTLSAQVDFRTNVQDIFITDSEEAGSITMAIESNAFPNAAPDSPVFIAVNLMNGAKLNQTLVDYQGEGHENFPIYLALRYEGNTPNTQVEASADAISIVRWIQGESAIWIRVQRSTDAWLSIDGNLGAPNLDNGCAFTIGVSARNSWTRNSSPFALGLANLEANQRVGAPFENENSWVSTLLVIDASNLSNVNAYSEIKFTPQLVQTSLNQVIGASNPQVISLDSSFPAIKSRSDDAIARKLPLGSNSQALVINFGSQPICEGQSGITTLHTSIRTNIPVSYSFRVLKIQLPNEANYGFPIEDLMEISTEFDPFMWAGNTPIQFSKMGYPVSGISGSPAVLEAYAPADARLFQIDDGTWLSRDLTCLLAQNTGPNHQVQNIPISIASGTLPTEVEAEIQIYYLGSLSWLDFAPFDLSQRKKPPIPFLILPIHHLTLGEFTACP